MIGLLLQHGFHAQIFKQDRIAVGDIDATHIRKHFSEDRTAAALSLDKGEDGKILSTLQWEGIREGLDDYRYIIKLEQCIAAAPGTQAAKNGKALLKELHKATIVDLNEYKRRFKLPIDIHQYCIWAPGKMDEYRNRIIAAILQFQK